MKNTLLFKNYLKSLLVFAVFAVSQVGFGQIPNGTLDFGTFANGTVATTGNTGFGGVRVGSAGGGFTIQNPGQTIGTGGELRGVAPTTASINSVGITSAEYGTASSIYTVSFDLHLSGGSSGIWYFFAGNGTSFAAAQSGGFTSNQVYTGLRWTFGASNVITTDNRAAAAWSTVTGTPFAQNTAYSVRIIGNNSATTQIYTGGSVTSYTYDLWINDILVGDDLAKGALPNGSNINAFRFYGENSTSNVAQIALDNVQWFNSCFRPAPTNNWLGSTSNSWNTASNWSLNSVPDGSTDVTILSGMSVLDVDYSVPTGKTLTVSGSGSLTINPTRTLTIAGTAAFGGKNVILKSDATGTGSIGQVTGTLTGATNVTVERYITGRRAFRFLTPSVNTTSTIFSNWQNGGATTPGIGTHITGGTTNGFDATATNNPSLHTYDAQVTGTTTGFVAAANTDVATLKAGVGYRLLVRGDRTLDLSLPSTDNMNAATTLSATGTLKTGTVTFNATDAINSPVLINNQSGNTQTNGYTLIGNPYASPVDWNAVTKTGVSNNAYYTWDPTLGTAAQRGRYVVYSADSGLTNLYDDNSVLSQTNRRYLQTGQAVFIKNTDLATPATLTFNEANKATVNSFVFRTNEQAVTVTGNSSLYLTVYDPNELAIGAAPIDGSVALFGTAYNNALDANDVDKLTTSGENVAFVRGNKNLAIETLAPVVANDELFVKTVQFQANKNYTFKVNTANFDTAVSAKMVDLYLNTETAIDLTQPSFVTFATTADANSYGADRFKIVFNNTALGNGSFNASAVVIYPNPIANNEFTLALPSAVTGKVTVSLSNMLGQEVYKVSAEATPAMQIQPKQQLEEGVYIVSVTNNGQVLQSKVVVRK